MPVVLLCTKPFAALARATASGLGLEQVPMVVITHPLAGIHDTDVADRAAEAYEQVMRVLTQGEGA